MNTLTPWMAIAEILLAMSKFSLEIPSQTFKCQTRHLQPSITPVQLLAEVHDSQCPETGASAN